MKLTTDEFTGRRLGKYEVLCRLAVGGMAEIFLAFPRSGPFVGRAVVLKRILSEQREDPVALRMLIDEAKLTATLSHPNVAQVLDLEVAADEVLLVIEYIPGANLEEFVEVLRQRDETLPVGFVLTTIRETAQGLGHAHTHQNSKGQQIPIIHRDVTPRNVMVDFEGGIKVLDFGIARAKGTERRTQVGMVRGTTAYMSPEQAIGKEVDTRTDLFSLGTIFHELLTGQRLFFRGNPAQEMAAVYEAEIAPPSRVNRRVPKQLDAVVMKALDRRIDRRYQTAADFVRELVAAGGPSMWPRARCAELTRERFANRQREIAALMTRIPRPKESFADEGRTVAHRGGPLVTEEDFAARTVINAEPLPSSAPARPRGPITDPIRESVTDAENASLPTTQPGLSEQALFGDFQENEFAESTRIIPGKRSAPAAEAKPVRTAQPSSAPLIVAALVALALGAIGGAFLFKRLQPAAPALGRVSIAADRPAEVLFEGQSLGATPANVVLPTGHHAMQLKEPNGTVHELSVDVRAGEETKATVKLDSLPKLP